MKLFKNKLSIIIFAFAAIISANVNSQNDLKHKKMFVRVFNEDGKKIGKGYIVVATDSTLELSRSSNYLNISLKDINYIKTKRSAGSNALAGSIAGATTMGILGAATAEPDAWIFSYTAAEGALAGVVIGGLGGGAIGVISSIFKNSKTIEINGDKEKWELFRETLKQKTSQ